ncbi:MAG: methyltransferase domain-containing protein [Acidobacteria bacterium]|nr:methyltransferase domain-containing protein [Acidobacteriota bacterium]MCB9397267.1 methyltransferase domain-containing protein [Acidobacteriota bacterium]
MKIVHLSTQEGYNRWAEAYDAFENPLVALDQYLLPQSMPEFSGKRVLDLGCGTGRYLSHFQKADSVLACDFSSGMLEKARIKASSLAQVEFAEVDVNRPFPFQDQTFDFLFSSLVLEHVVDINHFFRSCFRFAAPGASLLMSTMHPAMFLRQTQAHFQDGDTEFRFESFPHQVSEFVMALITTGWQVKNVSETVINSEWVDSIPKWSKWMDWPVHLTLQAQKST